MTNDDDLVPQLVEIAGAQAGRVYALPYGEHVLGRGGSADLPVDHGDVSRRHARLVVGPDGVRVFDLGSKNGLFAGERRIAGSQLLVHGQVLSIGKLQLRVNHPASQVSGALANAGEATVTATRTDPGPPSEGAAGLLIPLVGIIVFGLLVAVMLLR